MTGKGIAIGNTPFSVDDPSQTQPAFQTRLARNPARTRWVYLSQNEITRRLRKGGYSGKKVQKPVPLAAQRRYEAV
jgi:hypothetical protein